MFRRDSRNKLWIPRRRRLSGLWSLILALGLAAAAWLVGQPGGRLVQGAPHVTDGDSLRIGGTAIRLKGLDAPELHQTCTRDRRPYPCGEVARTALIRLVAGQPLRCRVSGRDRYGRSLAQCSVDGTDIGAALVRDGLAVSYGDYAWEEAAARVRSAGLWAGEFQRPDEWRRERRGPASR